jgi:hypothetical protein
MSGGTPSSPVVDFLLNVASNVAANVLILGMLALGAFLGRSAIRDLFRVLRFAWRMHRSGIINFYNSRAEYVTSRKERNLADYMRRAKRRFVYVGFYLAGGTERDRLDDAITEMLERGCEIEIVLLDADAPADIIAAVEQHLAITDGTLRQVLHHAHDHFIALRNGLSTVSANRFKLAVHCVPLVSSAMLIDEGEPEGRLLVDNKIHGAGRDRSFGIEFRLDQQANGLAKDFAQSFKRIAQSAN